MDDCFKSRKQQTRNHMHVAKIQTKLTQWRHKKCQSFTAFSFPSCLNYIIKTLCLINERFKSFFFSTDILIGPVKLLLKLKNSYFLKRGVPWIFRQTCHALKVAHISKQNFSYLKPCLVLLEKIPKLTLFFVSTVVYHLSHLPPPA